jgi:LysR family glycine cleavage system transcriptional activator
VSERTTPELRKLPPLNGVKAFEAAARLMSFTKAGEELNVTHGAISRQVALLEEWLGVALFQRVKSQLELTEAGRNFLTQATGALDQISTAFARVAGDTGPTTLTVNAPPTFTLCWLIPRLSMFQRRHADINVRLTASLRPVDFSKEKCHIAIRGGDQPLTGYSSRAFLTESILPVCHTDLPKRQPLSTPRDLAHCTLLGYSTQPYGWDDWFKAVGAQDVRAAGSLNFEQMYFTLQAALEGLGVALIPYFLVADDIAAGRLCAPFGTMGVRTRHYYAYLNPATTPDPSQDAFCNWLEQEGTATTALCEQLMTQV